MRQVFIFFLCTLPSFVLGQSTDIEKFVLSTNTSASWIDYVPGNNLTASDFFSRSGAFLGLSEKDQILEISTQESGALQHVRFQQFHEKLRVLGAHYLLHFRNGELYKSTGVLARHLELPPTPVLTQEEALRLAVNSHPGHEWAWQLLNNGSHHPHEGIEPAAELVIADKTYPQRSEVYTKAWLIEIISLSPWSKYRMLIDAYSGEIIMNSDVLMSCGPSTAVGITPTLYHGIQDLPTLKGQNGLHTLSGVRPFTRFNVFHIDTSHFEDEDGVFQRSDSAVIRGAADAFWSTDQTIDFLYRSLGRYGVTNQKNDTVNSYIFPFDLQYNNAFWDGTSIYYGGGDGVRFGPFTSIDICAHEITHGITQHTAGLEYTYESGALNESISDIFGKTIEYFRSPDDFSWELGGRIAGDTLLRPYDGGFRNMMNPNKYGHPKYYKGRFWYLGRFDNGGVHFNSGVLNYWYYLLAEGFDGVNEVGDSVLVEAIGYADAIEIVYYMLNNYLTPTSQYADAQKSAIASAIELFGRCSPQHLNVARAWHAVGIGSPVAPGDMSINSLPTASTFCQNTELYPKVEITNNSCGDTIPAGTDFEFSYRYRDMQPVTENWQLTDELLPGGHINYSFRSPVTETTNGRYDLVVGFSSPLDTFTANNIHEGKVEWRSGADFDVEILPVYDNRPPCERNDEAVLFVSGTYHGCTPIYATDSFLMSIEMNGQLHEEFVHPFRSVYPGGFVFFGPLTIDNLIPGQNRARIRFDHLDDPIAGNNWQVADFYVIRTINSYYEEHFDSSEDMDSSFISISQGKYAQHAVQDANGAPSFVISGSSILDDNGEIRIDTNSKNPSIYLFQQNDFISNIHLCYNSDLFIDPVLEFEMMHEVSDFDFRKYGSREELATITSVNYDGFVEFLIDQPIDSFKFYTYDLNAGIGITDIRIANLALTGQVDSLSGQIMPNSDKISFNFIRIRDRSVATEEMARGALWVQPNPTDGRCRITSSTGEIIPEGLIRIFDSSGQMIDQYFVPQGLSEIDLELNLLPGIHFLHLAPFDTEHAAQQVLRIVKK